MNKYSIIIILFISISFGHSDDIPYDWSGQYGVISNDGRLMWNQDWTLGVLLIDGTFANYPTRFGSSYKTNFELLNTGDFYQGLHSFPDSSKIKSRIDYYRGDFSYDQLEIDVEFAEKSRIIALNGFKRTYNGPYGQYADPQDGNNPLQQSYRLDYSSKDMDKNLDISIGHLITDSRLNLSDPADFIHKEKIVAAGIGYSKNFNTWNYKVHGAFFQQYYSMSLDSVRNYLNRLHLNQFISRNLRKSGSIKLGIQVDNQSISFVDSTKRDRLWSTIYGGWERINHKLELGTTFAQKKLIPYGKISTILNESEIYSLSGNIKYSVYPVNIIRRNYGDLDKFNELLIANLKSVILLRDVPLNFQLNCEHEYNSADNGIYDDYDISPYLISSSLYTLIPIFRDWEIDVHYRHTFEHNFYSDGIGDRIKLGININEKLFKNNMLAQLHLWADAYLNHNPNLGFQGFHYGPYTTSNADLILLDYWLFNLELSAKISKMTIIWKVNNILQTAESITNQLFPNLNDKYLLITNSHNFPPMNRFVTFCIIWNFDD